MRSFPLATLAFLATATLPIDCAGPPQIPFAIDTSPSISPRSLPPLTLRHGLHIGTHEHPGLLKRRDYSTADLIAMDAALSSLPFYTQSSSPLAVTGLRAKPFKTRRPKGGSDAILEFARRSRIEAQSSILEIGDDEEMEVPDTSDKDTVLQIAKLTYNAYHPPDDRDDNWYDVSNAYNNSIPFGWENKGIRGHFFATPDNSTVVIAIKGTSGGKFGTGGPTEGSDRTNDNLLFSCCCAREGWSWPTVCDCYQDVYKCGQNCVEKAVAGPSAYYSAIVDLFTNATEILFPDPKTKFWVVGHSLGGSLSSLMALTFGLPAVAFEAPGEKMAAQRLHLPSAPAFPDESLPIWHFGHTADPIYMGACNGIGTICWVGGYAMESQCHLGKACVYDTVTDKGWAVDSRTHRIQAVIENVISEYDDVAACEPELECIDCGLWEFVGDKQ